MFTFKDNKKFITFKEFVISKLLLLYSISKRVLKYLQIDMSYL